MARGRNRSSGEEGIGGSTAANIGYEAQLWQMADALRWRRRMMTNGQLAK
jgi:hypothetical protein